MRHFRATVPVQVDFFVPDDLNTHQETQGLNVAAESFVAMALSRAHANGDRVMVDAVYVETNRPTLVSRDVNVEEI